MSYGPNVRFALAAPVKARSPEKTLNRRKVFAAIAAYLDAGRSDPSIRELAGKTKLDRGVVIGAVDSLEHFGFITVARAKGERNVYSLPAVRRKP